MNTQQIQCFLYVADRLNFTKAAEDLYLSVPTVTHHIKCLEDELQTKLFFRTSRIVRLTEAGNIFYKDAKDIFDKIMASKIHLKHLSEQNTTFFRIGCSSNNELDRFAPSLMKMYREFPHIHSQVFVHDAFSLRHLFENRQLDLVISSRDMMKDMKQCHFKKVKIYKHYAILPSEHPLSLNPEISLEALDDYCLITLHPRHIPFHSGNELQEYIVLHAQNHADIICENDAVSILMAQCGYGIAILPEYYIPATLNNLTAVPIKESNEMDYGVTYYSREKHIKYFLENYTFPEKKNNNTV